MTMLQAMWLVVSYTNQSDLMFNDCERGLYLDDTT